MKFSEEIPRGTYYKGQSTIPSDTVCYPAKLTHGHIESLLEKGVDFIFYPCMSYNIDEGDSDNHFNCPVVAYYPELLMANCEKLNHNNFLYPFLDLNRRGHVVKRLSTYSRRYATKKQEETGMREDGFAALNSAGRTSTEPRARTSTGRPGKPGKQIIVLAGRPYHIDPEINHGIHKLIGRLGLGGHHRGQRGTSGTDTGIAGTEPVDVSLQNVQCRQVCHHTAGYAAGTAGILWLRYRCHYHR